MKDILYKQKEGRQYSVLQNCKQLCQHSLLERSINSSSFRCVKNPQNGNQEHRCWTEHLHSHDWSNRASSVSAPTLLDHNSLSRRHNPQCSLQTCKTKKIDSCLSHIRGEPKEQGPRRISKAATCFKGQPDINSGFLQQNWWVEPNLHSHLHFCSEAAAPVYVGCFHYYTSVHVIEEMWLTPPPTPEVRGVDSKLSSTQQQRQ